MRKPGAHAQPSGCARSGRCGQAAAARAAADRAAGNRAAAARDADQHALGVVAHLAGQPELAGDPPDGGPKPDALHAPSNADLRHFHSERHLKPIAVPNGRNGKREMKACRPQGLPSQMTDKRTLSTRRGSPAPKQAATQSDDSGQTIASRYIAGIDCPPNLAALRSWRGSIAHEWGEAPSGWHPGSGCRRLFGDGRR